MKPMRFAAFNTVLALILCGEFAPVACLAGSQEQTQAAPQGEPAQAPPNQSPGEPQPQTPPQETPPQETPKQETPKQETQPQTPAPQETPPSPAPQETPPTAKPKTIKKKRKPAGKTQTGSDGGKVVIRNGGAKEDSSQISPGMSDAQAQHQREITNQLLANTDANLKRTSGKPLTPAQQSMLDQINTYVRQSKAASDSGDVSRAHTLAFKAHLLSAELARK
jgi:outer membrane biosynthesis protein TonB